MTPTTTNADPHVHPFEQVRRHLRRAFYAVECAETEGLDPATLRCALAAREIAVAEMIEFGWTAYEAWRVINSHDVKPCVVESILDTHRRRTAAEIARLRVLALAFWQWDGYTVHPEHFIERARGLGMAEAEIDFAGRVATRVG